jgi:hypothetical protein
MISVELSKMSFDTDSSVHLAASLEQRKSSRKNSGKNKPYLDVVVVTPRKLSTGKRKPGFEPGFENHVILLQVSVLNNSIYQKLNICYLE